MAEQVRCGRVLLSRHRELGPPRADRTLDVCGSFRAQAQRAHSSNCFSAGEGETRGVTLPPAAAARIRVTCPQVGHQFIAQIDADGGTRFLASLEMRGEYPANSGEPGITAAVDVGNHRPGSPSRTVPGNDFPDTGLVPSAGRLSAWP